MALQVRVEYPGVHAAIDDVQLFLGNAEVVPDSSLTIFELQITAFRRALPNNRFSAAFT